MKEQLWMGGFSVGLSLLLLGCAPPANSIDSVSNPSQMEQSPSASLQANRGQSLPISAQFEFQGQVIQLEVAQTQEQQAIGLMFRTSLPDDRGMLFSFDPPRPVSFWMRNTLIPLDMVFLRNGEVKAIVTNAPPCTTPTCPTYGPGAVIDQVIELRGGRAAELGLRTGDRLTIQSLESRISPALP